MTTPQATVDVELDRIDAAEQWLETLREGAMDEPTLAAWLSWSADARNLREFERLQQIWQGVERIDVRAWRQPQVLRIRRAPLRLALAATVVLAVGVGTGLIWLFAGHPDVLTYRTSVAVTSDIPLADGSRVQLGPVSTLSAHLTEATRVLRLEAGEAYFEVAKDPLRPFVVNSGELQVTAIGTAFNVHHGAGKVRVTVTEGAIRVAAPTGESVEAGAGQQVEYTLADRRLALSGADPEVATAWRSGVLKFIDAPLSTVVADLNRYSERRIVIDQTGLDSLPYTGTVFVGRIDQWLIALQDAFPLRVQDDGERRVYLRRR